MTKDIFSEVVDRNVCIGCGACAAVQPDAIRMLWDDEGFFKPSRIPGTDAPLDPRTLAVCPFNDDGRDEDWIADRLFSAHDKQVRDSRIGYYIKCFIGYCPSKDIRANATSGGIIGWVIRTMLSEHRVDRVIAFGASHVNDRLFDFQSYRSVDELDVPMKSRYYPSEFSNVVRQIIDEPGTVLFVGLPCQIKALRKLAIDIPVVGERVKYTVSLFCGHQKSRHYADYLALHAGVDPASVTDVDYRKKREGHPASAYGYEITYKDDEDTKSVSGVMRDVYASSWSNNLFMNPACEFCDDVVGETADLSVGDAWLPGYVAESQGTSICIVRNPDLLQVMMDAHQSEELCLHETTADMVHRSQEGGFRQRRESLSFRLALASRQGRVVPRKRVCASAQRISFLDRVQQRLRIRLREESNRAFRHSAIRRDLVVFRSRISHLRRASELIVLLRKLRRKTGLLIQRIRMGLLRHGTW